MRSRIIHDPEDHHSRNMHRIVDINTIRNNPYQPRSNIDPVGIEDMAASIKRYGVLHPLLVRDSGDGTFELIAGQRRLEGSRLAGLTDVPVIIREASDSQMLEIAMIENIQREEMSPVEKARGFKTLMNRFNLTQNQIAGIFGLSRPAIANTIRLLDLPDNVKDALDRKKITEGHARALLLIKEDDKRELAMHRIISGNLTVRDAEKLSKIISKGRNPDSRNYDNELSFVEEEFQTYLMEVLGTRVHIKKDVKGGKIVIEFYSDEHLTQISELFDRKMGY